MVEFDTPTVDTVAQFFDQRNNDETEQERQWWEVAVRPPEEYDDDPRKVAERLYADLHAHGQLSFEIHSNGPEIALKVVAPDRPTAETVARHVRSEIGAQTDIQEASVPISSDDPIAAAEFEISKDVIFPLETTRTSKSEVGQLHHLLDTFAADDIRGCYQVVVEPVEGDWTARRSRALPESISEEQDPEEELKRAGMAMVPVFALSFLLSPWPVGTSLIVALGLVMAATIGEGVSIPEHRTAGEIAREHRERTQERHGAQSSVTKQAKQTADEIIEQAGSFGWKASIRLVVSHDENRMVAADIRDSLVAEVESAFSSETTGQELTATPSTGEEAREVLDHVRTRHLGDRSTAAIARRLLGKGTRKDLHVGPGEFAVLGYFPGADGGGGDSRGFASESDIESLSVLDAAPSYTRPQAVSDGGTTKPDYILDSDRTETRLHPEYGEVDTKVAEHVPDDDDDYYAGEFARELVETSQQNSHYYLGYVEDGDQIRELGISADQLRQHIFIGGASGAGKTTLAEAMLMQHSWADRGFAALDPHDDLIDRVLEMLPKHRKDDVIVVEPANIASEFTHTLNFLSVELDPDHPDYEAAVAGAVDDTVGVLCQGASNVGDRMKDVLYGLIRGMIQSQKDYTFLDMREILRNEDRQEKFALQMHDEGYGYLAEFAEDLVELSSDDLAPVTRLLNKWVLSPTAREIISHTESTINFREIIEEDKILLLRGEIDNDELQQLVATAILKKLYRAAKQRPRGERPTYPILIDEADDIYTDEMGLDDMLGNARKFGVSLTLMTQKPNNLSPIRDDIETNCKTFVSYRNSSTKESRAIAKMLDCDQSKIGNLGDYRALIELDLDGSREGPFTTEMLAPIPAIRSDDEAEQEIVIPSRRENGVKRDDSTTESIDEDHDDQDDEDSQQEKMDEFVQTVAHAAADDDLQEDEHYTFVNKGKSNESLVINPSRVIEALDDPPLDDPQEYTALSGELVDDETSYVNAHRKRAPSVSRGLGLDINAAVAPLSDVRRGMFE